MDSLAELNRLIDQWPGIVVRGARYRGIRVIVWGGDNCEVVIYDVAGDLLSGSLFVALSCSEVLRLLRGEATVASSAWKTYDELSDLDNPHGKGLL